MSDLETIARRHDVPLDAAQHLLDALVRGGGRMAQFNHPAFGGMGQLNVGGMIMIGDMFNNSLKARVAALADDLVPLADEALRSPPLASASAWWPPEFGRPSSSGSQNDARYAVFPDARRLVVDEGGRIAVYDTGDHHIGGVSQQQGGGRDLSFSSQYGSVRLHDLRRVTLGESAAPAPEPAAPQTFFQEPQGFSQAPQAAARAPQAVFEAPQAASQWPQPAPAAEARTVAATPPPPSVAPPSAAASQRGSDDVFASLERLADLRQKGVLTDAEFASKKAELLSRI